MLKSSLYDYSDAYVLVSGTKRIVGEGAERLDDNAKRLDERNKRVIFKKLCTIHWLHKRNKQCSSR